MSIFGIAYAINNKRGSMMSINNQTRKPLNEIESLINPPSAFECRRMLIAFSAITEKIAQYKENLEELLQAILGFTISMPDASYAAIILLDEKQTRFLLL